MAELPDAADLEAARLPGLGEAAKLWARIGWRSFGGPAAQIALLHEEVIAQRHWLSEQRFLQGLGFCSLLPGPEAMQLATYLGLMLHGPVGGLLAGGLFILPGAAVLLGLSLLYVGGAKFAAVAGLFFGLKCATLSLVVQALQRISKRALHTPLAWVLALASFAALSLHVLAYPAVVLGAALLGVVWPAQFDGPSLHGDAKGPGKIEAWLAANPGLLAQRMVAARKAGVVAGLLWVALPGLLGLFAPGRFAELAWFFSRTAVVTLGGAYGVMAYVANEAVSSQHWLSAADMLAGLGLAETTPGPLLLVLQFVGFIAGYHAPGLLAGIAGGVAGSLVVLWASFVPSFAMVFLGAPLVEAARARRAGAALAAISASVVGVIGNLALWFGLHVLFAANRTLELGWMRVEYPVLASLDVRSAGIAAVSLALLFGLRLAPTRVLAACAALGCAAAMI